MPLRGRGENRGSVSATAKGETRLKGKGLVCGGGVQNLCRAVPAEITLSMASQEETGITQRLPLGDFGSGEMIHGGVTLEDKFRLNHLSLGHLSEDV